MFINKVPIFFSKFYKYRSLCQCKSLIYSSTIIHPTFFFRMILPVLLSINIILREGFRDATNRRLNTFPVSDRSKDSAGHHDSCELPGTENNRICSDQITNTNAFAGTLKALLIVKSRGSRQLYSTHLSSFRFRFAHVLRVQENV